MILTAIFTILSAWYDNGKRFVDHTPIFIFRVIVVGLMSYFSAGNFIINFAQNTAIFYLFFDYSLNLFEGRNWNYVGSTAPIYNVIFNSGEWDFDIKDLNCLTGLTSVTVYTGAISGDIATAPSGLTYLAIYGQNTLSGDIATAPSGLTVLSISGQNTLSGNIATAPSGLTVMSIEGQNTLSGNIATAPSGLTYLSIRGQNTLSGDIATAPSGLTNMSIIGQNTISGDIATAPSGLTVLSIGGQNTLSGSLDSLQNTLTYYSITGLNSISTYSGVNLNSGFTYFLSQSPNACFNSSAVDALFIELETTIPGITYINITGCAAPPTGASLTARNNLIASGCTVIHN